VPYLSIKGSLPNPSKVPYLSIEDFPVNPSKVPYSNSRRSNRLDEMRNPRMRLIANALAIKLSQIRFLYDLDDPLQLFTVLIADGDLSLVIVTFDLYGEFQFFREA
jgi:hypothetical protein